MWIATAMSACGATEGAVELIPVAHLSDARTIIENPEPSTHWQLGRQVIVAGNEVVFVVRAREPTNDETDQTIWTNGSSLGKRAMPSRVDYDTDWLNELGPREVFEPELVSVDGGIGQVWMAIKRIYRPTAGTLVLPDPPNPEINDSPWAWFPTRFEPAVVDVDGDGHVDYLDVRRPEYGEFFDPPRTDDGNVAGVIHLGPLESGDHLPWDGIVIAGAPGSRVPLRQRAHRCRLPEGDAAVFAVEPGNADELDDAFETLMVAVPDLDAMTTYEDEGGVWRQIPIDALPELGHGRYELPNRVVNHEFQDCGDFDGDGVDEFLFDGQFTEGQAGPQRTYSQFVLTAQRPGGELFREGWRYTSERFSVRSARFVPDLNDDGREDIVAVDDARPRPEELGGGTVSAVLVFLGNEEMELEPDVVIWADERDGLIYLRVEVADLDEDGVPDLVIGAPGYIDPEFDAPRVYPEELGVGRIYVVHGRSLWQ